MKNGKNSPSRSRISEIKIKIKFEIRNRKRGLKQELKLGTGNGDCPGKGNESMNEQKKKTQRRVLAVAGLMVIALLFLVLIYGALTHNTGLLMLSLICLIMCPIMIHFFLVLIKAGKRYSGFYPEEGAGNGDDAGDGDVARDGNDTGTDN